MFSGIKISAFTGRTIASYLPAIARLRTEVFQEYPYLYPNDLEQEIRYLQRYIQSQDAMIVVVFNNSMIVGVSMGLPLNEETAIIQKPFLERQLNPASYFYFSESVLLEPYRRRGIGHHFYDLRESHAENLKKFQGICLCSLVRPDAHPKRPKEYMPCDNFWTKRGYIPHPELKYQVQWKDIDEQEETEKTRVFWIKEVSSSLSKGV